MYVTISNGMRGWYAVLCDKDGPIQTGIGSYATAEEAEGEAASWAMAEQLPFRR